MSKLKGAACTCDAFGKDALGIPGNAHVAGCPQFDLVDHIAFAIAVSKLDYQIPEAQRCVMARHVARMWDSDDQVAINQCDIYRHAAAEVLRLLDQHGLKVAEKIMFDYPPSLWSQIYTGDRN